jgi:hypothetical protein
MLFREIIAVYSVMYVKHINAVCGKNSELFSDKAADIYVLIIMLLKC